MQPAASSMDSRQGRVVATIHEFCRSFDRRDWASLRSCLEARTRRLKCSVAVEVRMLGDLASKQAVNHHEIEYGQRHATSPPG